MCQPRLAFPGKTNGDGRWLRRFQGIGLRTPIMSLSKKTTEKHDRRPESRPEKIGRKKRMQLQAQADIANMWKWSIAALAEIHARLRRLVRVLKKRDVRFPCFGLGKIRMQCPFVFAPNEIPIRICNYRAIDAEKNDTKESCLPEKMLIPYKFNRL